MSSSFDLFIDNENPNVTCPTAEAVNVTVGTAEGMVIWMPEMATAIDVVDGNLSTSCTMSSGGVTVMSNDLFPEGVSLVTCNATDDAGNTGMCQFNVTVNGKSIINCLIHKPNINISILLICDVFSFMGWWSSSIVLL